MKSKGFTLIELVVVIVIMGILAAVAIPLYVDLTTDAKISHDTAQLAALQSCTHMLYAKNALSGTAVWPAEDAVISNMSVAPVWQYYGEPTYADGVWTMGDEPTP